MCGIVAIYSYANNSPLVDRSELLRIRESMVNRGPDAAGNWFSDDNKVGLGHRRLSVIDLSDRGNQPMISSSGASIIVFNGEIYNHQDLRKFLKQTGYRFRSESDTEIILAMYEEKGPNMVKELRGMFAFALWDVKRKALFLARDTYGIKPLYFADDGKTIRVASQVKSLLSGGAISKELCPAGSVGFFLLGSIPEPYTLYQDIQLLPAGHTLWIDENGRRTPSEYLSIARIYQNAESVLKSRKQDDVLQTIHAALTESVKYHLIADVPIGLFLSSGLDSSSLLAIAAETGYKNLQTLTLAFNEYKNTPDDETCFVKHIAAKFGTQNTICLLTQNDFLNDLDDALKAMDQPSIDGLNTYFICKFAAKAGYKVVLTGTGGDELFGGYPSFWQIPLAMKFLRFAASTEITQYLLRIFDSIIDDKIRRRHPKLAALGAFGHTTEGLYFLRRGLFMPREIGDILEKDVTKIGLEKLGIPHRFRDPSDVRLRNLDAQISMLESSYYLRNQLLRDADWASMAHSLELRMPFVDSFLLAKIAPILIRLSGGNKKHLLYRGLKKQLPSQLRHRKKSGFSLPMSRWINKIDTSLQEPWSRQWARKVWDEFKQKESQRALST